MEANVQLTRGQGESRFPLVVVTAVGRDFTDDELDDIRKTRLVDKLRALSDVYDVSVGARQGEVRTVAQSDASAERFYTVVQATLAKYFEIQNTTRVNE